jgi:hypothetical protein
MLSKLDTLIGLMTIATGMMAFENSQRAEITPAPPLRSNAPSEPTSVCLAASEYQRAVTQRMMMMAFGIAVPEPGEKELRLLNEAASCG